MKTLRDKNIVVTGAAAGIGKHMAVRFLREGCNIALIDRDRKALRKTEGELSGCGGKTAGYVCDVSRAGDVEKTARAVLRDFGRVDVLVNNAGIVAGKIFLDLSVDEIKKVLDVNFMGAVRFIKHFLPGMAARNSGHIVNMASLAGLQGVPGISEYCASKFAVVGLTDSLRLELRLHGYDGIGITCVCPYFVDTDMLEGFKQVSSMKLLHPDDVACRVVKAVKKRKPHVIVPWSMNMLRWIKLLPAGAQDRLLLWAGDSRLLDKFIRKRREDI